MPTELSTTVPFAAALPVAGMLPRELGTRIRIPRVFTVAGYLVGTRRDDEAELDDGQTRTDGEWQFFLDLVEGRLESALATLLADDLRGRLALGSSDEPATHCLLLDLLERRMFVAPLADARQFLHRQHARTEVCQPEAGEPLSAELLETILWDIANELVQEAHALPSVGRYRTCAAHCQHGWLLASDGGYDPCPECGGEWLVSIEQKPAATI